MFDKNEVLSKGSDRVFWIKPNTNLQRVLFFFYLDRKHLGRSEINQLIYLGIVK